MSYADVGVGSLPFFTAHSSSCSFEGCTFPRGLFWADAEPAPESTNNNRYVGYLLFELLVPALVICFPLSFLLLLIYLFF